MVELEERAIEMAVTQETVWARQVSSRLDFDPADMDTMWQNRLYNRAAYRVAAIRSIQAKINRTCQSSQPKRKRVYLPAGPLRKARKAELQKIRTKRPDVVAKRKLAYANRTPEQRAKAVARDRARIKDPKYTKRRRELYANRSDEQRARDKVRCHMRWLRRKARLKLAAQLKLAA